MSHFCNAYGAENPGGVGIPYGGLTAAKVETQPECHAPAEHRFRWVCENGHEGPIVWLCEWHYAEFSGLPTARFSGGEGAVAQHNGRIMTVPWNMRRQVQVCYRCSADAPACQNPDHLAFYRGRPGRCGCQEPKVNVRLVTVS